MDQATIDLLHKIHEFKGFAPFLPEEILENKGDVKVYLDDACTRKENVTLAQLEKAQLSLEDELSCLKELLTKLQNSLQTNGREIENLLNRIRKIEDEIQTIKGIISRLRAAGKDSYTIEIELLGYYIRKKYPKKKKSVPEIHLMIGTIERRYPSKNVEMTGIVFVHELMHAYFDNHNPYVKHSHCPEIEEPMAEYGMLCFMEMFERANPSYKGIFDLANQHVEDKKYSLGLCHYGFGGFLFEDRKDFGVDWVSLFRSVCPALIMNAPEVKAYESMISLVRYPRYERACECKLFDVLKPKRFFFSCMPGWRDDGSEVYFHVNKSVADSTPFMIDYPPKKEVVITFYDKSGTKLFTDIASVQSRGRFRPQKVLTAMFYKVFGMAKQEFAFYEEKPSDGIRPAEWVACEIDSGSSPE